ncbi:MAG: hypothetical protein JW772_01135 [Candidatus Diapherotrites archaeon]|nr:hypothetical protein [Candidatus Diapherotrites archaeon]
MKKTFLPLLLILFIGLCGCMFPPGEPSGGVTCQSSDPVKLVITRSSNISVTGPNEIVLINGTGGQIKIQNFSGADSMSNATLSAPLDTPIPAAEEIKVLADCGGSPCTANYQYSGSVTIEYLDQFDYEKTAIITCQGTVP